MDSFDLCRIAPYSVSLVTYISQGQGHALARMTRRSRTKANSKFRPSTKAKKDRSMTTKLNTPPTYTASRTPERPGLCYVWSKTCPFMTPKADSAFPCAICLPEVRCAKVNDEAIQLTYSRGGAHRREALKHRSFWVVHDQVREYREWFVYQDHINGELRMVARWATQRDTDPAVCFYPNYSLCDLGSLFLIWNTGVPAWMIQAGYFSLDKTRNSVYCASGEQLEVSTSKQTKEPRCLCSNPQEASLHTDTVSMDTGTDAARSSALKLGPHRDEVVSSMGQSLTTGQSNQATLLSLPMWADPQY
jgi:hypothetical protein